MSRAAGRRDRGARDGKRRRRTRVVEPASPIETYDDPRFGKIPLIAVEYEHRGALLTRYEFDPAYEPPLPPGAVRADIRKQTNCGYGGVPLYYYVDSERRCTQCGERFTFYAREQRFWYETLGIYLEATAVRCVTCRKRRRTVRSARMQLAEAGAALERAPEDPAALLAYAEATAICKRLCGEGNLERAIGAARRALALFPAARAALYWEGECQALARRPARARELFERFVAQPGKGAPRQLLATARQRLRDAR